MRKFGLCAAAAVACAILASCGSSTKVAVNQNVQEGNDLFASGRYAEALVKYQQAQATGKMDSAAYRNGTIAAQMVGQDSLAAAWGSIFSSKSDTAKLKSLGLSLEKLNRIDALYGLVEEYRSIFCTLSGENKVLATETQYYAENNDERIVDIYTKLQDNSVKAKYFDVYYKLGKQKVKDSEMTKVCKSVLGVDPNNKTALEHIGKERYETAENKYVSAMNEYNKKKSQAAYAYLTRDLKKVISPIYRESRDCYEKLRKIDPSNKTYIKYLINIYGRLDNKAKVKELEKAL